MPDDFDIIDRRLLSLVQRDFPLVSEPYKEIGRRLGISEGEVINRIERLKAKRIVRQISPVLDARRLGYKSTLVAMKVVDAKLDRAKRVITEHPGVSHGYEREHQFNLWFTLTVPPAVDLDGELQQISQASHPEVSLALPAKKLFKIGAYFDIGENGETPEDSVTASRRSLPQEAELSQADRLIINELQQDLPLVSTPFDNMAAQLGMDEKHFLAQCESLLHRGIMRRYGASVNHRRVGFDANAMACWIVPPDSVDAAGQKLASLRQVSHCYERQTNPLWQYNLFAVVHCRTRDVCQNLVSDVSREIGLNDYILLFSTVEFKKTRVKYLV